MPNCLSWAESDYESKVKQHTGKLLSEALIFASTNPQYEFQAQTWGEHVVYRNCFLHSEQFLSTTCSAKRRASVKDLPVLCFCF